VDVEKTMCGGKTDFTFGLANDTIIVAGTEPVAYHDHSPKVLSLLAHIFDGHNHFEETKIENLLEYR